MSSIKFVVLSDTHIGAENSLLTNLNEHHNLNEDPWVPDNSKPSPVLEHLIQCLKEVIQKNDSIEKPKLVLNGDFMELSSSRSNESAMAFQRFLELAMPKNSSEWLFDKDIILIPGNHDHNLWETAREGKFTEEIAGLKPLETIDKAIHSTHLFNPEYVSSGFLNSIINVYPHLRNTVRVRVVYPAYGILHADKDKCIIISHGHFIESMYSLMSTIDNMVFNRKLPENLHQLETQNFAWIDFMWSVLGRSGKAGADLALAYDKLQEGKQVKGMIDTFCKNISLKQKNFIVSWIEKKVLEEVLTLTIGKFASNERKETGILSPSAEKGLENFLSVFIKNQMESELSNKIPKQISFLFGHTHKPFEQDMKIKSLGDLKVYNSGGWVVDTINKMPFHGGSVLLIDDDLDIVALQMYKEGKYKPTLEVSGKNEHYDHNPLYKWLSENLKLHEEPWSGFENKVELEVNLRHKYLKEIDNKPN